MKKLVVFAAAVLVMFFLGCSKGKQVPGGVVDSASSIEGGHKIVTFYVTGKGLEPENAPSKGEAILMAERAAIADGYRQMVEKVRGVYVEAFMKADRGTISQDAIQVHTQSWLRGTETMEISQGDYGITTARLRLRINFSKEGMIWWPVGI